MEFFSKIFVIYFAIKVYTKWWNLFYNAKSCKYNCPKKQPFLCELLHYNIWGGFLPPFWSHSAWTKEMEDKIWINAKTSSSIEFQLQHGEWKEGFSLKEQIPQEYHEYLDIFDEDKADRFPSSRSWDHKIELKEGFQPKSFKSYNLTPEEQTELDKILKDNLEKKYI